MRSSTWILAFSVKFIFSCVLKQSEPSEHPGVQTGVPPKSMQLFDLQNDPSEQTDVANENPDIVARLKAAYDRINREVPLEKTKS